MKVSNSAAFSPHCRDVLLKEARIRHTAPVSNYSVRVSADSDILWIAQAHVCFDLTKLSQSVSWVRPDTAPSPEGRYGPLWGSSRFFLMALGCL